MVTDLWDLRFPGRTEEPVDIRSYAEDKCDAVKYRRGNGLAVAILAFTG